MSEAPKLVVAPAFDLKKFHEETKHLDGFASALSPERARALGVEIPGDDVVTDREFSPLERKLGVLIPRTPAEQRFVDELQAERLAWIVGSLMFAGGAFVAWAVLS